MRTTGRPSLGWALAVALSGAALGLGTVRAADHRDGPKITDINTTPSGALDLNDLFIFQGSNRNNTVLIQTMSPGAGVVGPGVFFPGAAYDLLISNDGNPLTDEILFRTTFSTPDSSGRQRFEIRRDNAVVASGTTNSRTVNIRGGGRATAGIFDDPFFFDVNATARLNRELTLIGLARAGTLRYTTPDGQVRTTLPSDIDTDGDGDADVNPIRHLTTGFPNNFFGGFNTLAIVIEIPRLRITSRGNPNFSAHMRAIADAGDGRGVAQFDRTAIPSINTVISPLTRTANREILSNGVQDQFNFLTPADDPALRPVAIDRLVTVFGLPQATATDLANLFLPDVANFNTTSSTGFPNGRRLMDDVIDIELGLLTNGALATDRVVGDSYFRRAFPYIGRPNPITTTIQALSTGSTPRRPAKPDEIDPFE